MFKNVRQMFMFNLRTAMLFEIIYKLAAVFLLLPLLGLLLQAVMQLTGHPYLDLDNVWNFLLNPVTILYVIFCIVVLTAYTMLDITTVIIILDQSKQQCKISVWQALRSALAKLRHLFNRRNILLPLVVLVLMPFLNLGLAFGVNSELVLPNFITNFIVNNTTLALLCTAIIIGLTILVIRWMYAFHFYVLEDADFKTARGRSRQLIKGSTIKDILILIAAQIIYFVLVLTVAVIFALIIWCGSLIFASWAGFENVIAPILSSLLGLFTILMALVAMPYVYTVISYRFYAHKKAQKSSVKHIKIAKPCGRTYAYARTGLIILTLAYAGTCYYTIGAGKYDLQTHPGHKTEIMAHRGYSSKYPENTMPAFRAAVEAGTDWLELDVHETKDGQIVISHDSNTYRVSGVDKNIWEATYDELAQIDVSNEKGEEFTGSRIPLFTELLDYVSQTHTRLNIELKHSGHEQNLEQKTIDLVRQYHLENQVLFSSIHYPMAARAHQLAPDIPSVYTMTVAFGDITQIPDIDDYSVESTNATSALIDRVHNTDKKIYAWTVDADETIMALDDRGIDAVITNDPANAKFVLKLNQEKSNWDSFFKILQNCFNL